MLNKAVKMMKQE